MFACGHCFPKTPYWSLYCNNINPLPIFLTDQRLQFYRYNAGNLKTVKKKKQNALKHKETIIKRTRIKTVIRQNIEMQTIHCTLPSCHFFEHMVSIIQMGKAGSSIAIAMFAKQIDP